MHLVDGKKEDFDRYLGRLAGDFLLDHTSEIIAILWGSVYVYDFLKSIGIIYDELYANHIKAASMLKGDVIRGFVPKLWNSNFVHAWNKPDSVSQNEFEVENNIFIKSYDFKSYKFAQFQSLISDELKNRNEPCPCGSGKKYKKCCGKLA